MYEQASERWSPVQSVEKVILSVISMLAGESIHVQFDDFHPKTCCHSSHHIHLHFATFLIRPLLPTLPRHGLDGEI